MPARLHYRLVGAAQPSRFCWVLHGLLGSGRNWASVANSLHGRLRQQPNALATSYVLIDLRCHGHTTSAPSPNTLDACVDDLLEFASTSGMWPDSLLGHSLGGKVLLQLASRAQDVRCFQDHSHNGLTIGVLDSTPGGGALGQSQAQELSVQQRDSVTTVLKCIETMPLPIPSRAAVLEMCTQFGLDSRVGLWLASNLTHLSPTRNQHGEAATPRDNAENSSLASAGYRWLFDPAGAAELFSSHNAIDRWDVLIDGPPPGVDVHLVMAERSTRWRMDDAKQALQRVQANAALRVSSGRGGVKLHTLPNAGHWLHVDNPEGLVTMLAGILSEHR